MFSHFSNKNRNFELSLEIGVHRDGIFLTGLGSLS